MTSVNIQESQTLLSRYVKRVIAGETIIPCDRNRPIAENRPIVESSSTFPSEALQRQVRISEDVDDPLPEFEREFYSGERG